MWLYSAQLVSLSVCAADRVAGVVDAGMLDANKTNFAQLSSAVTWAKLGNIDYQIF